MKKNKIKRKRKQIERAQPSSPSSLFIAAAVFNTDASNSPSLLPNHSPYLFQAAMLPSPTAAPIASINPPATSLTRPCNQATILFSMF
jgi:hypothetical protein